MTKDYRCKDCEFWKEYGSVCTKTYGYIQNPDQCKKCKSFKLKK